LSKSISTIIFDVGGVLIQIDGVYALSQLLDGAQTSDEIQRIWVSSPSVIAHETGKISAEEFSIGVVRDLKLKIPPKKFIADFVNWASRPFPGTFELLDALPQELTIAALSNTSAAHWERIRSIGLAEKFDQVYLSHEIGHLKPNVEPFEIALLGLGTPAEEVVFLDDNADNIKTALSLGFKAHRVEGATNAREVLSEYGLV